MTGQAVVVAVSANAKHAFSKPVLDSITLLEGLGIEGDAHMGRNVKHRSRVARDPAQPNLRQVHLIHTELFDELLTHGHRIAPGDLGENVATRGLDILGLCARARLHFSGGPIVEVTGLRNPCAQIENFRSGLLAAVLDRDARGNVVRKAGIMGIVIKGGEIRPGDAIDVALPAGTREELRPV